MCQQVLRQKILMRRNKIFGRVTCYHVKKVLGKENIGLPAAQFFLLSLLFSNFVPLKQLYLFLSLSLFFFLFSSLAQVSLSFLFFSFFSTGFVIFILFFLY
jgi:hypothetical protein